MRYGLALLALLLLGASPAAPQAQFAWFDYRGADPVDRAAKAGPGEYRNPILQGFYPDPSLLRVGADYYLVTSTFSYFPGLPIFHSLDLVSWTQIGNAIDRPGQVDFGTLGLSRGIYAPDLTFHDGVFYLAGTCVNCRGNFVMTAKTPAGPWSDPHWNAIDGIDPSLFFDADGSAWILNNGPPPGEPLYDGHRAIWIQRFDTKTLQPFGPRTVVVNGGVHPDERPVWIEGPRLFRRGEYYYLLAAEGGTEVHHSEVVFRSRTVTGPYLPGPDNPILTQRDLDPARALPITSSGHADFVTTPDGSYWSTFLATRPYAGDDYAIGRETFLLPVRWKAGWPQITAPGAAIPYVHVRPVLPKQPAPPVPMNGAFHLRETFAGPRLAPYWLMLRTPAEQWYGLSNTGLTLNGRGAIGSDRQPAFLGRRLQHHWAAAETTVRFTPQVQGDRAGLVVLQNPDYFYALSLAKTATGEQVILEKRDGENDPPDGIRVAAAPYSAASIRLRIVMKGATCDFLYAGADGAWHVLAADADATILSTKHAGGFVGATIGPFARRGG